MPNSVTRISSTSSLPRSSRSLLSRFAPAFASKARNFTEFDIQLTDPHRQYSPGDLVTGTVVLKAIKLVRITHLVVSLHGYAQVYKTPNTPGEGYRTHNPSIGTGKGVTQAGYYGNGFATLFEDEAVLCGEGTLREGVYKFEFSLKFPSERLPSSIDFERGTISYMLTSTLTRPTTMSPTTRTDRKVYLIENIDIGPITDPKPRIISLEPKTARSRVKPTRKKQTTTTTISEDDDSLGASQESRTSELSSNRDELELPQSPAPSDVSFDTQLSVTTGSADDSGNAQGSSENVNNETKSGKNAAPKKPITATISLLKAGFLRGDTIQLRVKVNHTKYMKSLQGIIVTLYRHARVDMHPALPVVSTKDGKDKTEEYFPRSKTGLGGLSLSNSGSTHVFRKDLSQSFTPLIVDPRTFTADVKASVRVPDEAFPSITNVPGAMITFKYYVEVVIDLQAKMVSLGRLFPNTGMMSVPEGHGTGPGPGNETPGGGMFSAWGGNFVDTSFMRRDKGVVSCVFGVLVGTEDSERRKNKGKARRTEDVQTNGHSSSHPAPIVEVQGEQQPLDDSEYYPYNYSTSQNIHHHDHYYDQYGYAYHDPSQYEYYPPPLAPDYHTSYPLPPAATEDESTLPEKERLRRAEERLLPSAPPLESDPQAASSSSTAPSAPSAPVLSDEEQRLFLPVSSRPHASSSASYNGPSSTLSAPSTITAGPSGSAGQAFEPSAPTAHDLVPDAPNGEYVAPPHEHAHAPAPAYSSSLAHDQAASSSSRLLAAGQSASDDKQELHRRRLEMEQSAPPDDLGASPPTPTPDTTAGAGASGSAPSVSLVTHNQGDTAIPSAPEITDLQLGETEEDMGGLPHVDTAPGPSAPFFDHIAPIEPPYTTEAPLPSTSHDQHVPFIAAVNDSAHTTSGHEDPNDSLPVYEARQSPLGATPSVVTTRS